MLPAILLVCITLLCGGWRHFASYETLRIFKEKVHYKAKSIPLVTFLFSLPKMMSKLVGVHRCIRVISKCTLGDLGGV